MKKKNQKKMKAKVVIPTVLALSVAFGGLAFPTTQTKASEASILFQAQGLSKEEVVKAYLQSKVADVGLKMATNIGDQFKVVSELQDSTTNTYHVRTIEQYMGIPIYGSGQAVALDQNNNVYASFGAVTQKLARTIIPTEASISEEDAIATAKDGVVSQIGTVKHYDGIDSELTIYPYEGKNYLTYLVKVSTSVPAPGYFHYFVDATTGEVIDSFNAVHEADLPQVTPISGRGLDALGKLQNFIAVKDAASGTNYLHGAAIAGGTTTNPNIVPVHTYEARRMGETGFILLSGLLGFTGFEVETKTNFFADPAAVSAHTNSVKVNNYYQSIHKRNSLDGTGMPLISTVHIGSKWNNAAWNGKQMLYGDGDGVTFSSLAGGLDVAGHEMTHGVISKTANLTYQDESGAINESLADIFGALAEMHANGTTSPSEWEMGEDIFTPYKAGDGGLRSLSDPGSKALSTAYLPSGRYPDHYDGRYLGTLDKGGVHINSSINNKAAYLISEGGTHYGVTVTGITRQKTEKIYYRALTLYLTPSSGFKEMRQAAIQAARDLYPDKNGAPSKETKAVMDAYDAVGVPAQ
ncbi:M4 family metallopeptidase [Peribacillus alkalitolerans]|uniref:M4 family metallopeptidase n=1 Tax=Peribacillus alkalitolerans TaxID=1550385 RepID=UPI0023DDC8DF|nr:M4 family metallopeptidase [Peribacillus alkalitolerans]